MGQPAATEVRRKGRKLGGLKVRPVGSPLLKGETCGWLKLDRPTEESGDPFPPGFIHLPVHAAGEEFCRQLCAEQLVARAGRNGFRRLEWIRTRERNEALDRRVYARAAAAALGLKAMLMPSGAFHDAQFVVPVCPTGMLFVPCRAGVSHHPSEYAEPAALAAGAPVLAEAPVDLAAR